MSNDQSTDVATDPPRSWKVPWTQAIGWKALPVQPRRYPSACLAAFVAPVASVAVAAAPTTPGGLRVDVHSPAAAELFWRRSTDADGGVAGYEIRRDGELLDTRDALSYFTDSLADGRPYAFSVTAIDADGERSAPASIVFVGGDRGGAVGSGGGRPPPPANLHGSVYSSSAAQVFRDRADRRGLSYEVRTNGAAVAATDGTSPFLPGSSRTDGTTVEVVAIDASGRRSAAATVTLGDSNAPTDPIDPMESTAALPVPANARVEVYSGTAAELFWDRAPAAAGVASARIERDGTTMATTRGTSFFDDRREPGRDYLYEVSFVDVDGTASAPARVGAGPGGTTDGPSLAGDDAPRRLLPRLIELAAGGPVDAFLDSVALPESRRRWSRCRRRCSRSRDSPAERTSAGSPPTTATRAAR